MEDKLRFPLSARVRPSTAKLSGPIAMSFANE
jgi:hypothetical protein